MTKFQKSEKQECENKGMITVDDKAFNGVNYTQGFCDAYNALQVRIESFKKESKPVPEHLLKGSFNLFNAFILATSK